MAIKVPFLRCRSNPIWLVPIRRELHSINDRIDCMGQYTSAMVFPFSDDSTTFRLKCNKCGHIWERVIPNEFKPL